MSAYAVKQDCYRPKDSHSVIGEYVPYSLKQYRNIARPRYATMGGLGSSYVGTQAWNDEDRKRKRREDYARKIVNGKPIQLQGKLNMIRF